MMVTYHHHVLISQHLPFFKKSCLHLKIPGMKIEMNLLVMRQKKSWAGWPGLLALAIAFLAAGKLRFNPLS
jgi:hypothetical protein